MTKMIAQDFLLQERLIRKLYSKGSEFTEGIYLNFDKSQAMCMNSKSDILYFNFTYEGDKLPNFYINSDKFLLLCKSYPEISISYEEGSENNSIVFFSGNDQFKINIRLENNSNDLEFDVKQMNLIFDFSENKKALIEMSKVLPFIDLKNINSSPALLHLFYDNGLCSGLTNKCVFETNTEVLEKIALKAELVSVLNIMDGCKLYHDDNKYIIIGDNSIFITSTYSDVKIPPIHSENFISAYRTSNYIKVDVEALSDALNVLEGFNKEVMDYVIFMSYEKGQLNLISKNSDVIKKGIDSLESNVEEMKEMIVKAGMLKSVIRAFSKPYVFICNDPEKNSFELRNDLEDWTEHAICSKIKID